jgi:hypothetical protein
MASNHISITNTTQIGSGCNSAISGLRSALEHVRKMYAIMSEFADDTTALAGELGTTAENAAIVRSNFLNAQGVLTGADVSYLINRCGQ